MSDGTKINWADATWNIITGCSVISPACTNCYAMRGAAGPRLREHPSRKRLTKIVNGKPVWTGEVRFNEQWLTQPLHWKKPRTIFVCAAGDLFHENVPDEWIDKVFAVMALAPQHQFMVLTKRSKRMREYIVFAERDRAIEDEVCSWHEAQKISGYRLSNRLSIHPLNVAASLRYRGNAKLYRWPLPNVALGVTAEDQERAGERIPYLLATPAAKRFVSIEPMLGPVDLGKADGLPVYWEGKDEIELKSWGKQIGSRKGIGWARHSGNMHPWLDLVICGGESGPDARPMHPDWPRSLRDQCAAAGVPFNFKQWGEWETVYDRDKDDPDWRHCPHPQNTNERYVNIVGGHGFHNDRVVFVKRVGKLRAGRLLDGVEHDGVIT